MNPIFHEREFPVILFGRFRSGLLQVLVGAALFAASLVCTSSAATAFVDRSETISHTLPNGMEVLVREEPALQVVEIQVWVGAGSRDEPAGKEGVAHLFEHMIFKGTKKFDVGEIARSVEASGGDINAYTSAENTVYHVTIASEFFSRGLAILADAVLNPLFDPDELEREKLVVIEEIHRAEDNPWRVFNREMFQTAYKVHPYGRTVIGSPESVAGISRKDMIRFHRAWYVPENMKLVVVGGVLGHDVIESARDLFSGPERQVGSRQEIVEPPQEEYRTFRVEMESEPARLALYFPIGDLEDPETPVLDLAAAILSRGRSSRLPVKLRDTGLVHNAWAFAYTPSDPGLFVIGAAISQQMTLEALKGVLKQISLLQTEPVSTEELERARRQIISEKVFSRESVGGQARDIGYIAMSVGDLDFDSLYYSRLQSVDPQDILNVSRRVFRPEKATVGFLSADQATPPDDRTVARLLHETLRPGEEEERGGSPSVYRSVLPNGITLLVREDSRLPLVTARMGVLGGTRFESEKTQGLFNMLAHLITRGTAKHSAVEIARKLDDMSASLGGFSGRNSFGITGKFLSPDLEDGFKLMREILTEAELPPEEIELARARIISGIRARRDDMTASALDLFLKGLYSEHPFRFPVMGTEKSVASLSRQDLLSMLGSVIQPEGMVLSLAGDITVEQAYNLAQRHFGDLTGKPFDPGPIPVEMPRSGVVSLREKMEDKTQTHIILGYPGPSFSSGDRDALEVLNAVLAGQGGRLFTELRDKKSLAYSVFSFVVPAVDPGFIAFGIGTNPSREKEAVKGFLKEIRKLRSEPVSEDEMKRAATYLIGTRQIQLQSLQARADEVCFPELYGQDLERVLEYKDRILSVTPEMVRDVAHRYLDPENYVLGVVEGGGREK